VVDLLLTLPPVDLALAEPRILAVARAVFRRLVPQLVEATLVPSALCYAGVLTYGLVWGVVAATVWSLGSIVVRRVRGRRVSALLVVATFGLLVRLTAYLLSGSEFVYFVQPVVRTGATALLFLGSALVGRPLVARFAGDFCSFTTEVGARPAITALFRRLTYLWAAAQLVIAGTTLTLLVTVPVSVYIGTAAGAAWVLIGGCVLVTVADAVRTTRREGVRTVVSSGGRLQAVALPLDLSLDLQRLRNDPLTQEDVR
jgi:hypothetical protein